MQFAKNKVLKFVVMAALLVLVMVAIRSTVKYFNRTGSCPEANKQLGINCDSPLGVPVKIDSQVIK
ncbi:MAG: hypothetical protein K2P81_05030 [Bacteriovoracaceae bacterium]|nr:hypothetical protein [Bacteriovoracaceae bacterium]